VPLEPDDCIDSFHWLSPQIVFCKVDKHRYYLLDYTKSKVVSDGMFPMEIEA
jgi:hypothetical protein